MCMVLTGHVMLPQNLSLSRGQSFTHNGLSSPLSGKIFLVLILILKSE